MTEMKVDGRNQDTRLARGIERHFHRIYRGARGDPTFAIAVAAAAKSPELRQGDVLGNSWMLE